jgi:carboxyl-terminal processing protease
LVELWAARWRQRTHCIQRDSYPDGSDFVGIGVLPDVADQATIAGLRRGQDEVLDEAVATLLK